MKSFINFVKGIVLRGETSDPTDNTPGSLWHNSTTGRIKGYVQSAVRELVSTDQTQTLTNKSVDATANTITNISNTEIKTGAAIDRAKLAAGTNNAVVINNGSGVQTDEAHLAKSRGGTGADNTSVTFPTTGVVVTEDGTETLTNKTLTTPVIAQISNTGTLTLPTSTDTLVGRNTTDTLTNKTLTSPVINSPTGITKADVGLSNVDNTSDATKNSAVATLSNKSLPDATTAIVDDVDATKQLKFTHQGSTGVLTTININSTVGRTIDLPNATDTLVGRATGDVLTNKSISGSTNTLTNIPASTALSGQVPIANGGTGAGTKAGGFDALSPMTTAGDLIYGGTAGTGTRLAAGLANQVLKVIAGTPQWSSVNLSGINYISSNPDAEVDTSGWATYADAAGTVPVDGTGGSPNVTWTRSTSSPLRGTASFLFTKDAANRQGEGVGYAFTVDAADQGKILQISADYLVNSGTYASGDLGVYVYDVTNSQLIYPSVSSIDNNSLNARVNVTFQTNINSTSYRLILHVQSTSTSAYTVKMDNFAVGPQIITVGSAVAEGTYTPTFAGFGTPTAATATWSRHGHWLYVTGNVTAGTVTSTNFNISIPAGLVIDTVGVGTTYVYAGEIGTEVNGNSGIANLAPLIGASGGSSVAASNVGSGSSARNIASIPASDLFQTSHTYTYSFKVPIVGWGVGQLLSSNVGDNRIVRSTVSASGALGYGTSPTRVHFDTIAKDSHGTFDPTTNYRYAVPVNGTFEFTGAMNYGAAGALLTTIVYLYKNGSQAKYVQLGVPSGASYGIPFTFQDDAVVGDYYEIWVQNSTVATSAAGASWWNINKVSNGNQQITATEEISGGWGASTSSVSTGSSITPIFSTKLWDTHNAYNSSTGVFTAPAPGRYEVHAQVFATGISPAFSTASVQFDLARNGAGEYGTVTHPALTTNARNITLSVTYIFDLVQGETINPDLQNALGVTFTCVNNTGYSFFQWKRIK